jgi:MOSC domain-containing protein YiiM
VDFHGLGNLRENLEEKEIELPKEGLFSKVVEGGEIKMGDIIRLTED